MPLVFGRSILGFGVVAGPPAPTWTNPDLTTASYDSVSFSIASQDAAPTGIYFKSDGTKLYMSGRFYDAIYQYSLSTAWDLSTASYDSVSFSVATEATFPETIQFKTDGTSFYTIDRSNDNIYQYDLTTAWDISTASYANKSFSVNTQEGAPYAIFFKSDGTKVYMTGAVNDTVYQYSLSTAWDISTASYDSVSFSVSAQLSSPSALFFNPDGDKFWAIGSITRRVYQYSLSTAWDLSTASYDSINFATFSQDTEPHGLFFKSDGSKMYTIGNTNDNVYQYST